MDIQGTVYQMLEIKIYRKRCIETLLGAKYTVYDLFPETSFLNLIW